MTVGIVGLGLMGGSLARDLAAGTWRVQGTDRDPRTERKALAAGVIEGPIRIDEVDIVVLAVPVRSAPGWVRWLARELRRGGAVDGAVLTDLGSTKRSVMAAAEMTGLGARFVGSHPLTGDERSGWSASRTGLYQGATVWVCPLDTASPEAVDRVEALWRAVGAEPRRIDPAAHDRLMARI
ncbi:MAG: prephenate dehydrogenase/arogenate dehydrogenase family protein, partial [Gemmatimonadetes bacterium]|nr:prephenate dehydrogenase [Gemmatimonadota bacterium]NIQ57228.1 prephenate dehydrogenase [Gemmatimonadota bacterium]NIU77398.1 prephenate dehydrogenase/arogenate dehydrogenase family protein [Gammaproteobacteria bacterium]NIX46641.1 prephenate dehydrogenase/arogenate dehydrogenase family protein [Gemmatimonadota bacterium]NIY10982.1 prephenate dehydrogenase/arogenate dehydrogenase family protein [Gemmatimonadota bacterium]